ncbi:MAG TPA: N-acetyltransferase [Thermoanaerobaculia bacterium]|nr:N-acetyltransferase [Thermoanaerobaculia bacterium]
MNIRPERSEDIASIHEVNEQAFGRAGEADLVDALRKQATPFLSIVAEEDGKVVGHICFSPVTIEHSDGSTVKIIGLAPMAVAPGRQNQGIGSQLVRSGLEECRRAGFSAVVVLGHSEYYPRFGFRPASTAGLRSEYDVPDPVFMLLEFSSGNDLSGVARYHPAFAAVE